MVITCDLVEEGGVKSHIYHLAEALRRLGDEVWVVGPSRPADHGRWVRGFPGIVHVYHGGSDNRLGLLTPPWSVRRFFVEHRFDVVHVHEPCVPLFAHYGVWFTPDTPHVCTFHAYDEHAGAVFNFINRISGALTFPYHQRAIAVSRAAEKYARVAWRRPITIIPNGVSTRLYRPEHDDEVGRSRDERLRLLFVGRWRDPRKGLRYLIEACHRLHARGVPYALDVVGEGTGCQPLEAPNTTFHGIVSESALTAMYRRADVFVSPATGQESFGIILLEAMASGRAVVCSDIDGYREVVRPEGAVLVPPRDPEALAIALARLAADPEARRRMGRANRHIAAEFDWDVLADRVRHEYLAAIAVRGGEGARAIDPHAATRPSAA
jgi:phosphatidylinositol alpha-mannosyltransferase